MTRKSAKIKKIRIVKDPAKCDWMVHNMSKSVKNDFIALTKMKNFKSTAEALTKVLEEWNSANIGKQLWRRMETVTTNSTS